MTSAVVYIEKQFQIPSRLSGTMVSAGDFAYIPIVIFTSYFGGKGNRARWIGGGCMLISVANFLISSSNFLFPAEKLHVNSSYIPSSLAYEINRRLEKCQVESFFHMSHKSFQLMCVDKTNKVDASFQSLISTEHAVNEDDVAAARVLTSLPFTFCHHVINRLRQDHKADECKRDTSNFGPFMMIFGGLMLLGVGRTMPFSLGLPLMDDNVKKNNLPLYYAFMFFAKIVGPLIGLLVGSKLNQIYYTFDPPHGLTPLDPMWIGCWWLGFLIFGALLFFPSLALFLFPSDTLDEDDAIPITKLPLSGESGFQLLEFLFNKQYSLMFRFFLFIGKYLELQFGVPQHRIQKYIGRKAATWIAVCSLVSALMSFANAAVGCKSVIGQIGDQAVVNNFTFPSCRSDCECDGMPFYPVCNTNVKSIRINTWEYSPIFSPSSNNTLQADKGALLTFTECECSGTEDLAVSRDYCPTEHCNSQFFTFFINKAVGALFGGLSVVPGMLIVLRSVPPEHRSISLGFNGFLVSLFATLPSPVLWGKIFDMSCIMWQSLCNKTGACAVYDTDWLRIRFNVIYGSLCLIALLFDIWVIYWARGLSLVDEEVQQKPNDGLQRELVPLTETSQAESKSVEYSTSLSKEAVLED
uniref:Solute carrier organic anion transporter family member n=1 Tax=Angiostrongylus cantonensis TaxID=6313 RepID=A0A0K0CU04_ANGCA